MVLLNNYKNINTDYLKFWNFDYNLVYLALYPETRRAQCLMAAFQTKHFPCYNPSHSFCRF
jgi:hypothetical protein